MRVIWGGDATIKEIRRAALLPRATEITFADRYSLAVIDADYYWNMVSMKEWHRIFTMIPICQIKMLVQVRG